MANNFKLQGYTPTFMTTLFRVYAVTKGTVGSILMYGALPLFKLKYTVGSITYQRFMAIGMLPWAMKPLMGAVSDTFPIYGWHKKHYLLMATLMCTLSVITLTIHSLVWLAVSAFATASCSLMIIDLLFEGCYSRIMAHERGSTSIAAYVWGCTMAGSVVGAIIVGPLGDSGHINVAFGIAIPLVLQLLQPLLQYPQLAIPNDSPIYTNNELLIEPADTRVTHTSITTKEWIMCISMVAVCGLLVILLGLDINPWVILIIAALASSGLHGWAYHIYTNKTAFWTCNLYMFCTECLYVDVTGAQAYFYTADANCLPGGPDFDFVFYTSTAAIISGVFGSVAAVIYAKWLSRWSARTLLQFVALLRCVSSFTDVVIAKRWNISVGISDKAMFLLGDAVFAPVASMLVLLPMVVITASFVDKGTESTTYAILAGFQNLGQSIARIIGIALMHAFAINLAADPYTPCNFDGYPALLVLSHMLLPTLCIPLTYVLIPKDLQLHVT